MSNNNQKNGNSAIKKPNTWVLSIIAHACIILLIISIYLLHQKYQPHTTTIEHVTLNTQPSIKPTNQPRSLAWLKNRLNKNLVIDKQFAATDHLTGYIVHLKNQPDVRSIIYSGNHDQFVMMGNIIDKKIGNISAKNADKYLSHKNYNEIYKASQTLSGMVQGNRHTKHQVTIIIDPNSNTFPTTFKNLLNDVDSGVFSIKWVLLNYLKPNGPNVARNILQSKDPIAALAYNAAHYNNKTQTGGYISNQPATEHTTKLLRAHWDFVQRFNLYHLPLTLFTAHQNVHIFHGFTLDETIESYYQ